MNAMMQTNLMRMERFTKKRRDPCTARACLVTAGYAVCLSCERKKRRAVVANGVHSEAADKLSRPAIFRVPFLQQLDCVIHHGRVG
jgi:hypothetical protein